jgi:hypothetical protein
MIPYCYGMLWATKKTWWSGEPHLLPSSSLNILVITSIPPARGNRSKVRRMGLQRSSNNSVDTRPSRAWLRDTSVPWGSLGDDQTAKNKAIANLVNIGT